MPTDATPRDGAAEQPQRPVQVAVYPARMERAGSGRPCSPSRAYRLPEDPDRAAAAEATAGSRRTMQATAPRSEPTADGAGDATAAGGPTQGAGTRPSAQPAPVTSPGGGAPAGTPSPFSQPAPARRPPTSANPFGIPAPGGVGTPRHLAPAPWYRRAAIEVARRVRRPDGDHR